MIHFAIWHSFDICLPALPAGRQAQAGILTFEISKRLGKI